MANRNEILTNARVAEELLAQGGIRAKDIFVACSFTGTKDNPLYSISGRQGKEIVWGSTAKTLGGAFRNLSTPARRTIIEALKTA